jgi:hypothetical protein
MSSVIQGWRPRDSLIAFVPVEKVVNRANAFNIPSQISSTATILLLLFTEDCMRKIGPGAGSLTVRRDHSRKALKPWLFSFQCDCQLIESNQIPIGDHNED